MGLFIDISDLPLPLFQVRLTVVEAGVCSPIMLACSLVSSSPHLASDWTVITRQSLEPARTTTIRTCCKILVDILCHAFFFTIPICFVVVLIEICVFLISSLP